MSCHPARFRLFWAFFKSTLVINLLVSFTASVIAGLMTDIMAMTMIFPICFMSGGPLSSFFFKEVWRLNEYYFYYNRGISKYQLMAFTMSVYILLGISVLIII